MRDLPFAERQTLRALTTLAKFYAGLEMAGADCPLCAATGGHADECPIGIAWTIFDEEERDTARKVVRGWLEKARATDAPVDWPDLLHDTE